MPAAFDVVVTTNAGFPLDQNLYQCVKGLSAGAAVVRKGGTLVCAAECRDGTPDHGSYRQVLASQSTPAALLRASALTGDFSCRPDVQAVYTELGLPPLADPPDC